MEEIPVKGGIEYFFKKIPGRDSEIRDVDSVINQSGDLSELEGIDVIIKSISRLFLISKRSYFFDPDLGTGLYRYIFDPVDMVTKNNIEQEVGFAIGRYEGRADIKYKVLFFKNKKGFRLNLYIDYKGKKKTVNVDVDETLLKTLNR